MFGKYINFINCPIRAQQRPLSLTASALTQLKGAVFGVFINHETGSSAKNENVKPIEDGQLSKAGQAFNRKSHGALIQQLNCSRPLKANECRIVYGLDPEFPAVSVVGLNNKNDVDVVECWHSGRENARRAAAIGVKALKSIGIEDIQVDHLGHTDAAAEGSVLASFEFNELKTKNKGKPVHVSLFNTADSSHSDALQRAWNDGATMAEGQNFARRLMELPANILTPSAFADMALEQLKPYKNVTIDVRNQEWMEQQKMGALLAVAKGSVQEPRFLEISFSNGQSEVRPIVLVGKGVCFDSGGISLKPSAKMDAMRGDMGGAACVLAALYTLCRLRDSPQCNVKVLIPLVENMPSGSAVKPGDIVTAMNGLTIKIDNTDAEGRLILADALTYGDTFLPSHVIDVATLTGAMSVALGTPTSGVFANAENLCNYLKEAAIFTGDRVWPMPLFAHYKSRMKSEHADINNIAKDGSGGGACTAAAFLKEFVKSTSWAHIDIAGVMQGDGEIPYLGTGMTGRPTRVLVECIRKIAATREPLLAQKAMLINDDYAKLTPSKSHKSGAEPFVVQE